MAKLIDELRPAALLTDDALGNASDIDPSDFFSHFEKFGRWYWPEISAEAVRMLSLVVCAEVEEESPIDSIISAASAQAADGAIAAVAAALGVDKDALEITVNAWYETLDQDLPSPVGFDGLAAAVELNHQMLKSI